jgi:hypothetical protein
MTETEHEISCQNCGSPILRKHVFYLELASPELWDALTPLAAGLSTPTQCPECGHENPADLPFSVYQPQLNRMYHCLPGQSVADEDLPELFDFDGNPIQALVEAVLGHLLSTGAFTFEFIEYRFRDPSFSFKAFFCPVALVERVVTEARIAEAHRAKAQRYKELEPPADFLKRGSRLYKRNKIRFIYRLGQGFKEGLNYSEEDVESIILNERKYLPQNEVDGTHARVALVELGILERTSCGRRYWRKPAPDTIYGMQFPSRVEGFEKWGYAFYDDPKLGFSVNYRGTPLARILSFYVYGSPHLKINNESVEREFSETRDGMLLQFESEGEKAEILNEKRLILDKHEGRVETVCHLILRITDPDSTVFRSHLLLTGWGGRFIKVRMTCPDTMPDDEELLSRVVVALFKKIAPAVTPEPPTLH